MSSKKFDIIVIGLGPAGMAVSIMAQEMGLKVCAIEKDKIGGECMNVGCIPSKALLRMAKTRNLVKKFEQMELEVMPLPAVKNPFKKIETDLHFINKNKTKKMFNKVHLVLGVGAAEFIDSHTVSVGDEKYTAKRIYIATGTRPAVPPIPGINDIDYLTNETMFKMEKIPESMIIVGGGAIGCEMAQAFSRLGCTVNVVHMDSHLIPFGDAGPGELLEEEFKKEGIGVYNGRMIQKVENSNGEICLHTDKNEILKGKTLLLAAGRSLTIDSLKLEKANVKVGRKGIIVNKYLQTSKKHIYAVGDCNGYFLLSHAAMHQGMIALINSMAFWPFKQNFKKFVVPWTVFTDPQISFVGKSSNQLEKLGINFETTESKYEDYGAAIAENIDKGLVKVYASPLGKIYGASVVGEGSGEMINEWGLAIQKNIRLHDIMMLQHSFPSMSFLNKRIGEEWMMRRMKSKFLKKLCKIFF